MELKKDIQVYCAGGATQDRLFLSNGSEMLASEYKGMQCKENSFRPRKPWRSPNAQESDLIFTDNAQTDYRATVAVVKLPPSTIQLCQKLGLENIASEEELRSLRQTQTYDYMALTEQIDEFTDAHTEDVYGVHKIGFHLGNIGEQKGLEVATIDTNIDKLIGLHIDSWDKLPLSQIDTASNRICFNLGNEDRHLLLVNLSLAHIGELLHQANPALSSTLGDYTRPQLLEAFFKYYADYPVIKLKIKPYEAYIAPTENMIHDGDLTGKLNPDVTYTIRGYFDISPKPKQATAQ